jgi:hypothetical protein
VLHGLALLGLQRRKEARATLDAAAALSRVAAPTYCGPWAVAALALATDDTQDSRRLLEEGAALLARGCVSHNHFEFHLLAIEVSLRDGDHAEALRYAAALEAYAGEEPLPWVSVVVARARVLAGGEDREAVLDAARRLEFELLVPALLQPAAS